MNAKKQEAPLPRKRCNTYTRKLKSINQYYFVESEDEVPEIDLRPTIEAFSSRVRRHKNLGMMERPAQPESVKLDDNDSAARHALIMKALLKVRASLDEICKIDLGDRFRLCVDVEDRDGWPQLRLILQDILMPNPLASFEVSAHDALTHGVIEIFYSKWSKPDQVAFKCESELRPLAAKLKRCTRDFLDSVEAIIVAADRLSALTEDRVQRATETERRPAPRERKSTLFKTGSLRQVRTLALMDEGES